MTRHEDKGVPRSALGVGVVAMVLCCAGPALVAAGVLGAIGRLVGNPVVVFAAVAVATGAVVAALRRRGRGLGAADCCPPVEHRQDAGTHRPGMD